MKIKPWSPGDIETFRILACLNFWQRHALMSRNTIILLFHLIFRWNEPSDFPDYWIWTIDFMEKMQWVVIIGVLNT